MEAKHIYAFILRGAKWPTVSFRLHFNHCIDYTLAVRLIVCVCSTVCQISDQTLLRGPITLICVCAQLTLWKQKHSPNRISRFWLSDGPHSREKRFMCFLWMASH